MRQPAQRQECRSVTVAARNANVTALGAGVAAVPPPEYPPRRRSASALRSAPVAPPSTAPATAPPARPVAAPPITAPAAAPPSTLNGSCAAACCAGSVMVRPSSAAAPIMRIMSVSLAGWTPASHTGGRGFFQRKRRAERRPAEGERLPRACHPFFYAATIWLRAAR